MRQTAFVRLTQEQRLELTQRLRRDARTQRQRRRRQIRLLADQGQTDAQIVQATGASAATVERLRQRLARAGFAAACTEKPRSGAPAKLDGKPEALIGALACSDAPGGQAKWSAGLLAHRAVERAIVESIAEAPVRRLLKKTRSSRGRSSRGASRK